MYRGSEYMASIKSLDEKPFDFGYITAQFYKDYVIIGKEKVSLGQISTEILELSDEQLDNLKTVLSDLRKAFLEKLYGEYELNLMIISSCSFDGFAPYLSKALDVILSLPLYDRFEFDKQRYISEFREIYETYPKSESRSILNRILVALLSINDEILIFKIYASAFVDLYIENVTARTPAHFAHAIYQFLNNSELQQKLEILIPKYPAITFKAEMPANIEYVTCPDPDCKENYILAERVIFRSLGGFLNSDLFRGLNVKHSPKRCHNCKRFFLLPTGHDTHYCNRVAPNDPKGRICSKVGPHKKENSDEFRSPIKKEYDRAYDRLAKRKSNGLEYPEWLEKITLAMDIKERGESGEISLDEAIRLLKEI